MLSRAGLETTHALLPVTASHLVPFFYFTQKKLQASVVKTTTRKCHGVADSRLCWR